MHSNLKSRHNSTLPSEDPPENSKCPMVCNKPYPAQGLARLISKTGLPRIHQNSSLKIAKTFKPPRRNDPHPTKQKATKT